MKRLSTLVGLLSMVALSGHAQEYRDARQPVKFRECAPKRMVRTGMVRGKPSAERHASACGLIPVAIDSETGEACCLNAPQAGLLRKGYDSARA